MTPSQEKYQRERLAFAEFIKFYPFTTEDLDGEEWRDISGYEGLYQVSSFGRVKSFRHSVPKVLIPKLNKGNYLVVCIKIKKPKVFVIHRLVAKAFIPNPNNKPQVNHIDGCKLNAFVGNLEWVTGSENSRHALKTGLKIPARGSKSYQAKLTDEQVIYVRNNPDGLTTVALAKVFDVDQTTISDIQLGNTYKNAGGAIRKARKRKYLPDTIRVKICAEYIKGDCKFGADALARKYGVADTTIKRIVEQHAKITGGIIRQSEQFVPRVPDEIRAQIRAEYLPYSREFGSYALAKKYDVSSRTIITIVHEK